MCIITNHITQKVFIIIYVKFWEFRTKFMSSVVNATNHVSSHLVFLLTKLSKVSQKNFISNFWMYSLSFYSLSLLQKCRNNILLQGNEQSGEANSVSASAIQQCQTSKVAMDKGRAIENKNILTCSQIQSTYHSCCSCQFVWVFFFCLFSPCLNLTTIRWFLVSASALKLWKCNI